MDAAALGTVVGEETLTMTRIISGAAGATVGLITITAGAAGSTGTSTAATTIRRIILLPLEDSAVPLSVGTTGWTAFPTALTQLQSAPVL